MCSSPFDYMYIDLETCFETIRYNFESFLDPECLIVMNKQQKTISHSKFVQTPLIQFFHNHSKIRYMAHDYSHIPIVLNQKYIPYSTIDSNIYKWDRVCIFHNHNVTDTKVNNKIRKRCKLFSSIYRHQPKRICLFHITKII